MLLLLTRVRPLWPLVGLAAVGLMLLLPRTAVSAQGADSSEFVLAATAGALTHPPGFPLFSWLVERVWALAGPDANAFATLSTLTACLQCVALVLLWVACVQLSGSRLVATALSVAWFLFPPTLATATAVEVFALHHVLALLVVIAAVRMLRAEERPSSKSLFFLGLLCGVAGSHQPIVVFWAPVVIAAAARRLPRSPWLIVGCALGLTPYLSLFARFRHAPTLAFGHLETMGDLVDHMLRRTYGTFDMQKNGDAGVTAAFACAVLLVTTCPALVAGAAAAVVRGLRAPWHIVGCLLLHVLLAAMLRVWPGPVGDVLAARFFPSIAMSLALAAACAARHISNRKILPMMGILVAPTLLQAPLALGAADAKSDRATGALIALGLEQAPPNAVIIADGDALVFGSIQHQAVGGKRPDVVFVADGRTGTWWQRERIAARLPFARAIDVDSADWRTRFVSGALQEGLVVLLSPGAPRPPDLEEAPLGIWRQLFPAGTAPSREAVDERLLAACAQWPDAMARVDPMRVEATALRNLVLLANTTARLRGRAAEIEAGQPGVDAAATLAATAESLLDGDAAKARSLCTQALAHAQAAAAAMAPGTP